MADEVHTKEPGAAEQTDTVGQQDAQNQKDAQKQKDVQIKKQVYKDPRPAELFDQYHARVRRRRRSGHTSSYE